MKVFVISYKVGWKTDNGDYITYGGFPFQMEAISNLFTETKIGLLIRNSFPPNGTLSFKGKNISILPLPEPPYIGLKRKLSLLIWLPIHLPKIWKAAKESDAVYAPVPGDIGTIGIFIALLLRKPLLIRHCGTWGEPITPMDRFLLWLLERIAGGRNVVLATGGSDQPPSIKNHKINWIFSTSITQQELNSIQPANPWNGKDTLKLVTVGRITRNKNMESIIRALPLFNVEKSIKSGVRLHIVGDGDYRKNLEDLSKELNVQNMVTFHGNVTHEEVIKILSNSHLFVFPTRVKEGFPKAVLEALACGLPSVVTHVSVLPYIMKNCGAVIKDTSPQSVAKAINQLITEPQQLAKMSENARQVASKYTIEKWQNEIRLHLQSQWKVSLN